jgi:hypothetical protein
VRDQHETQHGTATAVKALNSALASKNWNANGSARNAASMFKVLAKLGTALSGAKYSFSQQDAVVSVARDLAQASIAQHGAAAMSATATLTANAEHSVLTGKISQAIAGFAKAYTVARSIKAPKSTKATVHPAV